MCNLTTMEPDMQMRRMMVVTKTKTKSYRRRNVMLASGVMLFVAAIALCVGLASSRNVNDDNHSIAAAAAAASTDDSGSSGAGGPKITITDVSSSDRNYPTRKFVSDACASTGDRKVCEEVCRNVPDCCNFHNGQDAICLQEEMEGCVTHAACQVLLQEEDEDGGEIIPAAPTELSDWCNGSNMAACEQACEPVACCYDSSTESCLRNSFLQCLDYAPCQNLRPNPAVTTAPSNLNDVCNPFTGDRTECQDICQAEAGCCWDENLFGGNCLANNFVSCLTYAPCGTLLLDNANGVIVSPPEDLDEICSIQNLLLGDSKPCEDACEPAECCVDLNTDDNCFLSDPLACVEYDACALLFLLQRGDEMPKPPSNLAQTCSLFNIREDPEPCQKACEVASCCVDTDFGDNCLIRGNALRCREYAPCALLAIVPPPDDGEDEPEEPPVEEPPVVEPPVEEGDPIEGGIPIEEGQEENFSDGSEPPVEEIQALEEPPEELSDVCNVRNVVFSRGRQECRDMCETATCCASNGDDNCGRENMATCLRWVSGGCWLVGF